MTIVKSADCTETITVMTKMVTVCVTAVPVRLIHMRGVKKMTDNTISRAAALNECLELAEARRNWGTEEGQAEIRGIDAVMCALHDLPPAQPGWIPVTERLPQNGYWLWSANGGVVKKDFYWDGHWELAEKYGYEVLAWMPLPTPYREGGQDEQN